MPDVKLLTAQEVATLLRMSVNWVYDHTEELGGVRVGRRLRFRSDKVQAYFSELLGDTE